MAIFIQRGFGSLCWCHGYELWFNLITVTFVVDLQRFPILLWYMDIVGPPWPLNLSGREGLGSLSIFFGPFGLGRIP